MDVYTRVTSFIATMSRDFGRLKERNSHWYKGDKVGNDDDDDDEGREDIGCDENDCGRERMSKEINDDGPLMENLSVLIVTHGLTLRLIIMRYFQLTVEEFEEMYNPPNGQVIILERRYSDKYGWEYNRLQDESAQVLNIARQNVVST